MTARPPLEKIDDARESIRRTGYDHPDRNAALWIIDGLRNACAGAMQTTKSVTDEKLRAALLHPQWGVPAYLADAAGDVASFFNQWDDRRADRAQDARDNKAADAADARMTW